MRNILVVGGSGYIGGVTTDMLVEKGYNVAVFDNLMYEDRYLKKVPFYYGDIRNTEALLSLHDKFDTIIWLAAIVGDGACAQDPELTYEVNYNAIKRFLDGARRRILFPSTCSVYGAQEGMLSEDSQARPLSVYAETKLEAEKVVLDHGGLVFRLGTLFGVGDEFSRLRLDLVVNVLTLKALRERRISVFGGEQWRPILNVRDVASFFVEAVTRDYSNVYNLAMRNVRIIELASTFRNIFPDLAVDVVEMKFEDARNYRVSTERADKAFLHKASITVETSVMQMKEILEKRRIKDPTDPRYYNTNYVKHTLDALRALA
jgi:nucleoside-diphosphate-sugar epimerase